MTAFARDSQTYIDFAYSHQPDVRDSQTYIDFAWRTSVIPNVRDSQTYIEFIYAIIALGTITVSCPTNNTATVGVAYTGNIGHTGGTAPFTYSIVSGSLPPGLTLNTTTGVISGVPTTAGTFNYTIKILDVNNLSATSACSIVVAPGGGGGKPGGGTIPPFGGGGVPCQ